MTCEDCGLKWRDGRKICRHEIGPDEQDLVLLPDEYDGKPLSWSMSRHNSLEECERLYFLKYYKFLHDDEIAKLRKLSALPLWAGNIVHDFAESFLKKAERIPGPDEQEKIIRQLTHGQMAQDWRYSEAGTKRFRLQEHEYGVLVSPEEKRLYVGLVTTCMRNFFRSPVLAEMFEVGRKNWLSIEDNITYDFMGTPVWVKMDSAYRNREGRVVINDWKTGRSYGKTNKAQLVGYAAYAVEAGWAETPEDVDIVLSYLAFDEVKKTQVDEKMIGQIRELIGSSIIRMRSKLSDGETIADETAFEKNGSEWSCRRCYFRGVCWPEKYRRVKV